MCKLLPREQQEICFLSIYLYITIIFTCIWSNYSDLTRPHPKWWFSKGNPLISRKPRLVKYYNLARNVSIRFFSHKKLPSPDGTLGLCKNNAWHWKKTTKNMALWLVSLLKLDQFLALWFMGFSKKIYLGKCSPVAIYLGKNHEVFTHISSANTYFLGTFAKKPSKFKKWKILIESLYELSIWWNSTCLSVKAT